MMLEAQPGELDYRMELVPVWEDIESIRVSVRTCLSALLEDATLTDSVAMTSAELLENALKHAGASTGTVAFELTVRPDRISVRVTNECDDESPGPDNLKQLLDWIASFDDPGEAYVAKMRELFDRSAGEGGFGLVRVAHEGGFEISCKILPGSDGVRVQVEAHVRPQRASDASTGV